LASPSIRTLVVDDLEAWRQRICSILQKRPELCVVADAADGLEAVQKAQALKPDLILLDIGNIPDCDQGTAFNDVVFLTKQNLGCEGRAMPQKPAVIELHRGSSAGVRILLADDFAPWRSQVRSFVQRETKWQIVFEACNGLEAAQKTVEIRPDVVLLDISMPRLNGIEAARRICQLLPECKIVILTQDADKEVMAAALQAGALAYVLKAEMTTELIPAVQAALRTRR